MRISWLLGGALTASLFVVSTAKADSCPTDAVFIHGSSASQKIVEAVAKVAATTSVKIIYSSSRSSCGGGVYDVTHPTGGSYVGTALTSFDANNQAATCTFDTPRAADIGVSDVYPSSCAGIGGLDSPLTLPADVDDVLGPVQAFTLAVHDDPSYPVAISAEAAFNTLGITGRGNTNWVQIRPGRQLIVGLQLRNVQRSRLPRAASSNDILRHGRDAYRGGTESIDGLPS